MVIPMGVKLIFQCVKNKSKTINCKFLFDHMDADVLLNGPVTPGKSSSRLVERKGSTWVSSGANINTGDAHKSIMLLWVNHIIFFHWSDLSMKSDKTKTKKPIVCSFGKNPAGAKIRINHRDDRCWVAIPHI